MYIFNYLKYNKLGFFEYLCKDEIDNFEYLCITSIMIDQLTKAELLTEIARLHPEHPVTASQLKRWVKNGFLPPPKAGKSRGKGLGIPQLWKPVCIPMIELIIASYRKLKPNMDEAGRRIFAKGFELRGDLIRDYLEEIPDRLESNLTQQRPFIKSKISNSSKASRLTESVKRRYSKDQPSNEYEPAKSIEALSEVVVGTAKLSVSQSTYEQLGEFLNPSALRETFQKVTDETLPIIFTKSQDEFCPFGFATRSITNLFREHGWSGAIEPIIPPMHSKDTDYVLTFEFRRSALLWGVLLYVHGQAFAQVLQEVIKQQFGQIVENMVSVDKLEQFND